MNAEKQNIKTDFKGKATPRIVTKEQFDAAVDVSFAAVLEKYDKIIPFYKNAIEAAGFYLFRANQETPQPLTPEDLDTYCKDIYADTKRVTVEAHIFKDSISVLNRLRYYIFEEKTPIEDSIIKTTGTFSDYDKYYKPEFQKEAVNFMVATALPKLLSITGLKALIEELELNDQDALFNKLECGENKIFSILENFTSLHSEGLCCKETPLV